MSGHRFAIELISDIDDRCDRSIKPVSATDRFTFHMIAAIAAFFHERNLPDEAERLACLLENDLLPIHLVPKRGTPEHRALMAQLKAKKVAA